MTAWRTLVGKEFNLGVVHGGIYWNQAEPTRGQVDLRPSRGIVQLFEQHRMVTRGHPLVWHQLLPDWLTKPDFSRAELVALIQEHVRGLIAAYKGQVNQWVVVNETRTNQNDFFYRKLGLDYVDISFETAREADPAARLIYNDTQNHFQQGANTRLTRQVVERLLSKGLVDAVGLQMHLDATRPPAKDDMAATMRSYGLPVDVTELDVKLVGVAGSQEQRFQHQAVIYRDVLEAGSESGRCESVTVWGIGDKFSWLEASAFAPSLGGPTADPTPYDDDLNPKPAYYAMLDVLKQHATR